MSARRSARSGWRRFTGMIHEEIARPRPVSSLTCCAVSWHRESMSSEKTHTLPCGNVVHSDGRIFSRLGKELKQQMSGPGYFRVELWSKGYGRKYLVHRLVADCFVPNHENKPQVNHKDGCKTNNDAGNLEWVTQSENQLHAYRLGLQVGFHVSGRSLSDSHKAVLRGSRWRREAREYVAGGVIFRTPENAAKYHGVNRQTVYNRAASDRFPDWEIKVWREGK